MGQGVVVGFVAVVGVRNGRRRLLGLLVLVLSKNYGFVRDIREEDG